jgi:hypothetical protein
MCNNIKLLLAEKMKKNKSLPNYQHPWKQDRSCFADENSRCSLIAMLLASQVAWSGSA